MAAEDINPNVVLTADNSQYDRAMTSSADQTMGVVDAVDKLGEKLNRLSKFTGKTLMGIAAADVAVITAATAAYASYEKQISQLQAQAAVLSRTQGQQQKVMGAYTTSVQGLRKEFGTSTSQAAALTQQIAKLADGTKPVAELASTFTKMGNATGESTTQLATSVLNLQKVMGTSQRNTKGYADQLTTLAAGANTTASALADFSSSIAPVGRLIGQSQTDITGVATAFAKAGQDGQQAANAYTKLVSDIAYATQTGSPELAKYANLVGMTVQQFKGLSGTEQVTSFFDSITRQGPKAIVELNKMGYDGMRVVRSMTALANQTGGIGTSIQQARESMNNGAVSKGSKASMEGITDEFARLSQTTQKNAESFGKTFAPVAEKFVASLNSIGVAAGAVVNGPLGKLAGLAAGAVAPLAGLSGALMTGAGALLAFSSARQVISTTTSAGFGAQMRVNRDVQAGTALMGTRAMLPLRPDGSQASWLQRGLWNMGTGASATLGMVGREKGSPSYLSRAAGWGLTGAGWGARQLGYFYSPGTARIPGWEGTGGSRNPLARTALFNSPTLRGSMMAPFAWAANTGFGSNFRMGYGEAAAGMTDATHFRDRDGKVISRDQARQVNSAVNQARALGGPRLTASNNDIADRAMGRVARSMEQVERQAMSASRGMASFGRGMGSLTTMLAATAGGAGRIAAQGALSMGRGAYGLLGGNPVMAGVMGATALYQGYKAMVNDRNYSGAQTGFLGAYQEKYGIAAPTGPGFGGAGATPTMSQARVITSSEKRAANDKSYAYTNEDIKNSKSEAQALAGVAAQWSTIKDNAEAVHDLAMDWTARFGAGSTGELWGKLGVSNNDATFNSSIDSIFAKGASGERKSWADKLTNTYSGSVADKEFGAGYGAIEDRVNVIAATQGEAAASKFQVTATDRAISAFAKNIDTGVFGGKTGEVTSQFDQATLNSLFGLDLTNEDVKYAQLGIANRDRDTTTTTAEYIRGQVGAYGVFGSKTKGGTANLEKALSNVGVTDTTLRGQDAATALINAINGSNIPTQDELKTLGNRLGGLGKITKAFVDNPWMQKAVSLGTENAQSMYQAVDRNYSLMAKDGGDPIKILSRMQKVRSEVGNDTDAFSVVAQMMQGRAQQALQMQMPGMTRGQQFSTQAKMLGAVVNDPATDKGQEEQRRGAIDSFMGYMSEQDQYFRQMILRQEEFEISTARAQEDFTTTKDRAEESYNRSRARAQEDFNLQRKYQEQDYQLSRQRAEADFQRTVTRSTQSYNRSMKRSHTDFHLSRKRQEEDYNHSVDQMVKQQAKTMYDAYSRIRTERTSGANFLGVNLRDQVEAMREQADNLDAIREMGLSDDAIQQLGLGSTDKAQQLSRLLSDFQQDPSKVADINKLIQEQLTAAGDLVTDESSNEWAEFQRGYDLARERAMKDFRKSVRRGRQDFQIQMGHMEDDFKRSMSRQAEDYEKAMKRQNKQFATSMSRAADDYDLAIDHMVEDFGKSMTRAEEDFDRMGKTVSGNLVEVLTTASKTLRGEVGKQADEVLKTFQGLETELGASGNEIMTLMGDIFGFDVKKVTPNKSKGSSGSTDNAADEVGSQGRGQEGTKAVGAIPGSAPDLPDRQITTRAEGGVLPGRSIGRDNMHFFSPEHGGLSLAGGEAIMVPEWVDQVGGPDAVNRMNASARYGTKNAFWMGGVMPLAAALASQHLTGYNSSAWSGDLNYPGYEDYGKPVRAWKGGTVAQMNFIGDDSYGRWVVLNHEGNQSSLYAHLSAFGGQKIGDQVRPGDIIGNVGNIGNTGDPPSSHLHFEINGGSVDYASVVGAKGNRRAVLRHLLKDSYPDVEQAAGKVQLNRGLFEQGFWSDKINASARKAWNMLQRGKVPTSTASGVKWNAEGGLYDSPQVIGVGEAGPEMVLPLDSRGAAFVTDVVRKSTVGLEARGANTNTSTPISGGVHYNYQIDRSTQFTGAITVQANNPGEFVQQMRQRQRVMALSHAALGGARV